MALEVRVTIECGWPGGGAQEVYVQLAEAVPEPTRAAEGDAAPVFDAMKALLEQLADEALTRLGPQIEAWQTRTQMTLDEEAARGG
jgi:hypothetical protein